MSVLADWINPYYLTDEAIFNIRESVDAKPDVPYCVLDNFFREDKIQKLVEHHQTYSFNEALDRTALDTGKILPYDGAVVFAKQGQHYGSELFYDIGWHKYCCDVTGTNIKLPTHTDIKLRWHKPHADGFWIHTDSILREMVIICYFNKGWKATDGGLLQLWRVDEAYDPHAFTVNTPSGRMDFLNEHKRIRTSTPGGGFPDNKPHDLVLIDQIVPAYNRVFMCNFQKTLAYHSVTPSNGKARLGFVQWLVRDV